MAAVKDRGKEVGKRDVSKKKGALATIGQWKRELGGDRKGTEFFRHCKAVGNLAETSNPVGSGKGLKKFARHLPPRVEGKPGGRGWAKERSLMFGSTNLWGGTLRR